MTTSVDRIAGLTSSVAIKAPCKFNTIGAIVLSGLGVQANGTWGAPLTQDDANPTRILVRFNGIDCGIWNPGAGAWQRARDFDGARDIVQGTLVHVYQDGVDTFYEVATADPVIGTSSLSIVGVQSTAIADILARLANSAVTTDAAALVGYDDSVAYVSGIGAFFNSRTSAEIAAGLTPTRYRYLPGDPKRYGAAADWNGSGGTDDTAVFRMLKALANAGQKTFYFEGRRYKLSTIADSEQLIAVASNDGATWNFDGAELVVNRTFTGSVQCGVFEFTACKGVTFRGGMKATCTQSQAAGQHTSRGPRFVQLLQGSDNFKADSVLFTDFREGYHVIRGQTDPRSYISRNPDFGLIKAYRTGYPCSGSLSGHGLKATIYAEECGRSFFFTGCDIDRVFVESKNHEASVNVLLTTDPCNDSGSAKGDGCTGRLVYRDTESTGADNSLNHVDVQVQNSDTMLSRISDLDLDILVANPSAGAFTGFALGFSKVTAAGAADAVDRGHILDGIMARVVVKAGSSNQRSLATQRQGTWGGTLDTFKNLRFQDQEFDGTGQPNYILTSLKDVAVIDGFSYTSALNVTGGTTAGSRVDLRNISAGSIAVAGGFVYLQDESEATVTYSASMTPDAGLAHRHIITATNGVAFTVNAYANPAKGMKRTQTIRNNSGGALGVATFAAVYKMSAWTQPATGFNRSITHEFDGTNWIEINRTPADVPN